jgi:hypothetical protein
MTDNTCARCGAVTPTHDVVSVASPDGAFRLLCSRCFNTEMTHLADVRNFEHRSSRPCVCQMRMASYTSSIS